MYPPIMYCAFFAGQNPNSARFDIGLYSNCYDAFEYISFMPVPLIHQVEFKTSIREKACMNDQNMSIIKYVYIYYETVDFNIFNATISI